MKPIAIGIDPGGSGAMFKLYDSLPITISDWIKNESTEADLGTFLRTAVESGIPHYAFIERVHAMPAQGVVSSFKFGQSYGFLRGLLIASGIPFEEVTPQKWQKEMGCLTKGDKNVSKARAQQLFPGLKITHANADALLIAEYGRRELAKRSHAQETR